MSEEKIRKEEFVLRGDVLLAKIKAILHAGNIRRITIKKEDGKTLIEINLILGLILTVIFPILAAIGAIVTIAASYRLCIEKLVGVSSRFGNLTTLMIFCIV